MTRAPFRSWLQVDSAGASQTSQGNGFQSQEAPQPPERPLCQSSAQAGSQGSSGVQAMEGSGVLDLSTPGSALQLKAHQHNLCWPGGAQKGPAASGVQRS